MPASVAQMPTQEADGLRDRGQAPGSIGPGPVGRALGHDVTVLGIVMGRPRNRSPHLDEQVVGGAEHALERVAVEPITSIGVLMAAARILATSASIRRRTLSASDTSSCSTSSSTRRRSARNSWDAGSATTAAARPSHPEASFRSISPAWLQPTAAMRPPSMSGRAARYSTTARLSSNSSGLRLKTSPPDRTSRVSGPPRW